MSIHTKAHRTKHTVKRAKFTPEERPVPWRKSLKEHLDKYSEGGVLLRAHRNDAKLTQSELGEKRQFSQKTIICQIFLFPRRSTHWAKYAPVVTKPPSLTAIGIGTCKTIIIPTMATENIVSPIIERQIGQENHRIFAVKHKSMTCMEYFLSFQI